MNGTSIKKALITGISGSGGSYLAEYIVNNHPEVEVHGITRWHSTTSHKNLIDIAHKIKLHACDLVDASATTRVLKEVYPDAIFHLASHANVREAWDIPAAVFYNNSMGTLNLLDALRTLNQKPIVQLCSCYDEETEVLTKRGFLKYGEIIKDDLVICIDPNSREVNYRPIKNIIIQDYEGPMNSINSRSVDLLITPNHNIVYSQKANGKLIFNKISELKESKNNRFYFPKGNYKGKIEDKITIGDKIYPTKEVLYLLGLYIGDGYSRTSLKKSKNKSGLDRADFLKLSRDEKGKFISKRIGLKEESVQHSHRIFLAIPEKDKARLKTIECLNNLGINYKLYKKEIYFSSKEFVELFDDVGHTAASKDIPEWVFGYDSSCLNYLYNGLIDSDGYYHSSGERLSTVSERLASSFTKLCIFTGRFVTVYKNKKQKKVFFGNRQIKTVRDSFIFSVSNKQRLVEKKNIKETTYKGKIWCLEIEETHNFVVRRNGKIIFCGNSSEVYGQVDPKNVPIKEDCPINPVNPYAVSKLAQDALGYTYFKGFGIPVIRTRMFAYLNPRRYDLFATSFAMQVARIEAGLQKELLHGNLESTRTLIDVRDAMESYWIATTKGKPGEVYNIGGKTIITVGQFLELLKKLAKTSIPSRVDPSLLRPADVTLQIPDTSKFEKETGWVPRFSFEDSAAFLLEHCRNEVKRS